MKPLLLGMNNPLSDDPRHDLFPYPPGCSGHRLLMMLPEGTTRRDYLRAFDRRDLIRGRDWDGRLAREAALQLLPELQGRLVVVLGSEVRGALGLAPAEPLSLNETYVKCVGSGVSLRWLAFPHPSGRNRWFNQPDNYQQACGVLTDVMLGGLQ